MTFKEYLLQQGVTEEKAQQIVAGMPAEKLYLAAEEHLDDRYAKLKDQKEQIENDLKEANTLVDGLKKTNKDSEGLQTKISEYEQKVQTLETERAADRKNYAIKDALTKAGVNDVDYMTFKLGDVETDKDGNLKGIDNKLKELKENNPSFFEAAAATADTSTNPAPGYTVKDNKLDQGKPGVVYSQADLENLSTKEINDNWEAVAAALEAQQN